MALSVSANINETITDENRIRSEIVQANGPVSTDVGIIFAEGTSYDSWLSVGKRVAHSHSSAAWLLGDWLAWGQENYKDRYRDAIDLVGLEYQTLRNYASVARRVPVDRRRSALSFQHHADVARLRPEQQELWLERAETLSWSRSELRTRLREQYGDKASHRSTKAPSLTVSDDALRRWSNAADRCGKVLSEWMIDQLNHAAEAALSE